jgi:hypothetical protein
MKRLKLYYFYVGLPVLFVTLGTLFFYKAILSTVEGNPHPQINYMIFMLIVVGCVQMLMHVHRINREGQLFDQYFNLVELGRSETEMRLFLDDKNKKQDVLELLRVIQAWRGKALTSVQHSIVEAELERFAARQSRRLMLSNFMSGMMVGLGLLGTFIGLLGALAEIGKLIGSFNMTEGLTDPIAAISELVARLTAPMQAMGVAFSASLFGVLGSLIMGVLMVSVKGASSDLVSLVQSDTSFILDVNEPDADQLDLNPMNEALAGLAEQAPLLKGLGVALDQSERRVRELLAGLGQLFNQIEINTTSNLHLVDLVSQQTESQQLLHKTLEALQANLGQLQDHQTVLADSARLTNDSIKIQQQTLTSLLHEQNQQMSLQLWSQQELWQKQANQQEELALKQQEILQKTQQTLSNQVTERLRDIYELWQEQAQQQDQIANLRQQKLNATVVAEQEYRERQLQQFTQAQQNSLQTIVEHADQTYRQLGENLQSFQRLFQKMVDGQDSAEAGRVQFNRLLLQSIEGMTADSQARIELTTQLKMLFSELQARQEQMNQTLILALSVDKTQPNF